MELYENISFIVNGKLHKIDASTVSPSTSLNTVLREFLHLTGTKRTCLEGGCGACVVSVKRRNNVTEKDEIIAVNSCLVSIFSASGWEIETIEGLGTSKAPNKLQSAIAKFHGTQCGYCTPGMIMNMYALKRSNEDVTAVEVENSFGGNICRCTGYRSILAALKSVCKDAIPELTKKCDDIEDLPICARNLAEPCINARQINLNCTHYYKLDGLSWLKVTTIDDLLQVMKTFQSNKNAYSYRIVAGNTARGVYKKEVKYDVYIDIQDVAELKNHLILKTGVALGANVTLTKAISLFKELAEKRPKLKYLAKVAEHIDLVANVPVRNIGTLAGNLMIKNEHKSFPSDIFLLLETVNAVLQIVDTDGKEMMVKPTEFLNIDMENNIIKKIHLPFMSESYFFNSFKIMRRAQNTHASINAAFLLKLSEENIVEEVNIVVGCFDAKIHANCTEAFLIGKNIFSNKVLQEAFKKLHDELEPVPDLMRPQPEFLKKCAVSLFYKFVLSIAPRDKLSPENYSGGEKLKRPLSKGTQIYESIKEMYPLSYPVSKKEGLHQSTGEAEYISDMPDLPEQLHAAFVLAKVEPLSRIVKIRKEKAMSLEGVVAFFDKTDIPGRNTFIPNEINLFASKPVEEELFCSGTVQYHAQPIGIIVATSREMAEKAAETIEIEYEKGKETPAYHVRDILKNDDRSRINQDRIDEPKEKGTDVARIIKGTYDMGWQYHFYMESQCCNVVYKEDSLDIWAPTQWMDLTQGAASAVLNIPSNMINVNVKRIGGAFGGKIIRNSMISTAAALAAYKLKKPVKMWLPLETNFAVIGKRAPVNSDYEIAVDANGRIQYLNNTFYNNHGISGNEDVLLLTFDLYNLTYVNDRFYTNSSVCDTNMHANTYTRAPGSLEGMGMIQSILEHAATELNMDPLDIQIRNLPPGKPILLEYINDLVEWADIKTRKEKIREFNRNNLWRKKGLSIAPMTYTMDIFFNFGVLVSVYHADGSVAISHGGVEIGQGINTKAIQTCAYKLGIPMEKISVKPSNNMVAANNGMTGGSWTSEAICCSVAEACDVLLKNMEPIRKAMENPTWIEVVKGSHQEMISLVATGTYSKHSPGLGPYHIYAVCATEVEVDILTGLHQITRVDIIEDVGDTMNPEIDVGQVEGAFVMGVGFYTTEKIVVGQMGEILTNRSWNYTPPGAKDIPIDFRIKFPGKNPNPKGVLKSKAVGEPALCLSVTVPLAIRNAVSSVRQYFDKSAPAWYPMDGPSDVENTFINCLHNYEKYSL